MVSSGTPSAQTLREIREIGLPIQAIRKDRESIKLRAPRLRADLIKITDDREVGRYRGEMRRRKHAAMAEDKEIVLPTEAEWLEECGELTKSFNFSYPVGQRRAAHMIEYAQDEAFLLLDGKEGIDWLLQGWEERINKRLAHTDQRVILGLGTAKSRENGVTETVYFTVVPVAEYDAWIQSNKADT
jgi:hypothetical protein